MGQTKKILVIGGAGYLGAHISLVLKNAGYDVTVFCRFLPSTANEVFKGIKILRGDIAVEETIRELELEEYDVVVQTVSLDHKMSETLSICQVNNINVNATWLMLEKFLKNSSKTFIYLSTIHVIGNFVEKLIDEHVEKKPNNIYAITHSFCEDLCNYYQRKSQANCVVLRLSNGYGSPIFLENNWNWLVVNDLTKMAFEHKAIVLNSDGTATRDFIHNTDIANCIHYLISSNTNGYKLFNVSSGRSISLLQLAHLVQDIYEVRYKIKIPVYYNTNVISTASPVIYHQINISNTKLKNFGFSCNIQIEEGINEVFNYLESISNYAKS